MDEHNEDRLRCGTMILIVFGIWAFIIVAIVKMCN